jgi:hypothetical protein
VETLVWLGGPFLFGLVLGALLGRGPRSLAGLVALGALVGFLLVLLAYLQAPRIYDGCSDCEQYLGRWWEPVFVGFIVAVGFVTYLVGIGVGALGRAVVGLARSD